MDLQLRLASTILMVLCILVATPNAAFAMGCGDVPEEGICADKQTMSWCEEGMVKSVKCPEGELCVEQTPWFDAAGCVAPSDTDCGDITTEGECTTANAVVWCEEGTPMVQTCDEGSVCGWDEVNGWYDCLSGAGMAGMNAPEPETDNPEPTDPQGTETDPPEGASDDQAMDSAPEDGDAGETEEGVEGATDHDEGAYTNDPSVPSPTVDRGLSQTTSDSATELNPAPEAAAGGCHGATGHHAFSLWSVLALAMLARTRRRVQRLI